MGVWDADSRETLSKSKLTKEDLAQGVQIKLTEEGSAWE